MKIGSRVLLSAFKDQPQEIGTILELQEDGDYLVLLDEEFWEPEDEEFEDDDGLREVPPNQLTEIP